MAIAGQSGTSLAMKVGGMIWMPWPEKASKVPTDVTRDCVLSRDLVDVKICAVDETSRALKIFSRKDAHATYVNANSDLKV